MKLEEYTITKSTVECYKIRHPSGMYWADITLDGKDNQVRIQIASDYGDYQYYWGACGPTYKEFLQRISIDYAATKFGADQWFDHEATIRRFKLDVIDYRRREFIDAKTARKLWNEIVRMEDHPNEQEFIHVMWEQKHLMAFYDHCPDLTKDITPQFKKFWATVWQVFLQQLKVEKERSLAIVDQRV